MVADTSESAPRENAYTCKACGGVFVTVDVDHGVTPFGTECHASADCHGMAYSSFYPRGPKPPELGHARWEWYRPESYDGLSPGEAEHVRKGGLLLRARTDKLPVYHGDDGDYDRVIKPAVERITGTPATYGSDRAPPTPEEINKMAVVIDALNRHDRRKRASQERRSTKDVRE